jgi:hypothetical protein
MGPLRSTCALKAPSSSLHRRSVPPSNSQAPKTAVNCTTLILRRSCGARASKDAPDGAEAPAANPCSKWRILESSFETRLRRSSGRGGLVGAAAQKCSGKPGSLGVPEDFYSLLRISMPRSPTAFARPCLQAPATGEGNIVSDFRQGIVMRPTLKIRRTGSPRPIAGTEIAAFSTAPRAAEGSCRRASR